MGPKALRGMLRTSTVSPYDEVISYEYLYSLKGASLKKIAEKTVRSEKLPSQVVEEEFGFVEPEGFGEIRTIIEEKLGKLLVAVSDTPSWPDKLADSERPTPLFYYYGDIGLMDSKSISIVGSRKVSQMGFERAARMAKELVAEGITVVSGLAAGVDTSALKSAIQQGGNVIGVIGTPIDECYPKENCSLQNEIAEKHLLVSQVPFYRYSQQPFKTKRYYFPERNELMAAISDATVIIEASDTSGTLTQARACLHQGRPLFILRSCYDSDQVTWPKRWAEKENVFIIGSSEEILSAIGRR